MAESQPILSHPAPQVIPPRTVVLIRSPLSGHISKMSVAYVYFIEAVGSGRVKIGRSTDVPKRLYTLDKAASSPFPFAFLGAVPESEFCETELHHRFAQYRVHKEWFTLSDEILAFISANSMREVKETDVQASPGIKSVW